MEDLQRFRGIQVANRCAGISIAAVSTVVRRCGALSTVHVHECRQILEEHFELKKALRGCEQLRRTLAVH